MLSKRGRRRPERDMNPQRTILLAEDNRNEIEVIRFACREAGLLNPFQVVSDGTEALDYLQGNGQYADRRRHPFPAVLLLDLKMPRVSGFEVLRWVRRESTFPTLPVVVLTHSGETADLNRAQELGADSYLIKPTNLQEFIDLLKSIRQFLGEPVPAR